MLSVVAVAVIALYLGLFLGPAQTPKLGLDLRGGTQVILHATPLRGHTVTKGALNQAVDIIRQRIDAAGVGGAEINTQGKDTIVVAAPGATRGQLNGLDQTALLRLRQVIAETAGAPVAVPTPVASATATISPNANPSASGSPAASPSGKTKKSSTSHDALTPALLRPFAKATPSPTPSAASGSATPTPAPSGSPTPTPTASAAAAGDNGSKQPVPNSFSPDVKKVEQVYNTYDCIHGVNGRQPTLGVDPPQDYIVACDASGATKFLLAPAGVEGTEISSAAATVDTTTNQWLIQLNFTGKGKNDWYNLTKKAYESDPPTGASYNPAVKCSTLDVTKGCNETAIVLDGVVQSAPYSNADGIAGGNTQITGSFTESQAKSLADVLKFGALPLKLEKESVSSVSASLGSDQLRGGLIAGAIGLGLVIIYSLLYYRALGLVTVASLALSGVILYAVTTLLGHSALGYTLSLPGIAGFIVAVGITADSFVVFFERIRDEVRDGKRLRSAVERAWPRARRTIISADAVSLLAAVVLYLVSIGDVRGFAFTLGLSTLSDLFIVFCFTKPLLALLARTKTFDGGHGWTGVGGTKVRTATEGGVA
jgi:preprotein translocase subunit SecD